MKTKKINKMAALFFMLLCLSLSAIPVSAAPKIDKKTATVYVNKTVTLKINGAKRKPKWKSSNTKIATVNKNGVVRGKKAGKVKITGYLNKKKYVCKITVKDKKHSPRLNYSSMSGQVGRLVQLKLLNCKPGVSWIFSSSSPKVASVSQTGKVVFKNSGTANVYAKAGTKRYKCTITVSDKPLFSDGSSFTSLTLKPEYDIKKAAPKAKQKVLDIFNTIGFKLKYRNIGNLTYGLTSTYDYDKSITLSTELFDTSKRIFRGREQITLETVTYHELGHFVAWITNRPDLTSKLQQIKKEEDKRCTDNSAEYFADSYMQWVLYRNQLKTERPKTYQYIKEQIDYINNTPMSHWTTGYY